MFTSIRASAGVFLSLLTFSLTACSQGSAKDDAGLSQIIGPDQRADLPPEVAPYIGALEVGGVEVCTGYASYQGEVTTAAHCIPRDVPLKHVSFRLADGRRFAIQSLHYLSDRSDLARLNVAGIVAYLPEGRPDDAEIAIYSYARDRGAFVSASGIFSFMESGHIMRHALDTVVSASGSPIVQNGRVVAVHLGAYGDANAALVLKDSQDVDLKSRAQIQPEGWKDVAKAVGKVAEAVVDKVVPTAVKEAVRSDDIGMDPGEEERLRRIESDRAERDRVRDHDSRARDADAIDRGAALF